MKRNMSTSDCIRWLWRVSGGYRLPVVARSIMGIAHAGVSLFSVWVSKCLIDAATGRGGDMDLLVTLLVACLAVRPLLSVAGTRLGSRTEIRFRNGLNSALFERQMESRLTGREALHTGDILNRMVEDTASVTDTLCRGVPAVTVLSVQLAGALWLLADMDAGLACAVVFIMPAALLLSKAYMRRMRAFSGRIRTAEGRIQSHMQEYLQHRVLVRTLEFTPRAVGRLLLLQSGLRDEVMRRADYSAFSRAVVLAGFAAGYATAFLWGVYGLRDGDKVLVAEGCTHHRQCEDIGTVKLPRWIREKTGVQPDVTFCSGRDYPDDLTPYRLVVHCGGCTLGGREMKYRQRAAADQGVPITNYGILIASLNGILPRTLAPFPEMGDLLKTE